MRLLRLTLAAAILSLVAERAMSQPLSGSYTVGGGGSYPDLGTALSALQANGVSGPVQFLVQANQTGSFTVGSFSGQGPGNPVSILGSGTASLSGASPVITLNGCAYVTIDGFSGTFGPGAAILIQGTTSNCVFSNCSFSLPVATSGSGDKVFSATGGTACRIEDSTFGGGYEAFNFASGDLFVIQRCRVLGGGYWICQVAATNFTFMKNFVYGSSNYGFRASAGSANLKIHNNSFYIAHASAGSQYCSLRWYSNLPSEVYNNAFHEIQLGTSSGFIMWCSGSLRPTVMDHNVYNLVNGAALFYWSTNYNLAAWQGTGLDLASQAADPMFMNLAVIPPDLHIPAISPCVGTGLTIATVVEDIDGSPRPQPYDVGAHEQSSQNILSAVTSGSGAGDLNLALTSIQANAIEGYTLISLQTAQSVGSGPAFGLWPDSLTWTILITIPIAVGNPLHFPVGPVGVFPEQPIVAPPGSFSFLAGQTWDIVAILLSAPYVYAGRSNVVRITW